MEVANVNPKIDSVSRPGRSQLRRIAPQRDDPGRPVVCRHPGGARARPRYRGQLPPAKRRFRRALLWAGQAGSREYLSAGDRVQGGEFWSGQVGRSGTRISLLPCFPGLPVQPDPAASAAPASHAPPAPELGGATCVSPDNNTSRLTTGLCPPINQIKSARSGLF